MSKKSSPNPTAGRLGSLHRGKRITFYRLGGADEWGEQWRERAYFYGWEGGPVDTLLWRTQHNAPVIRTRMAQIERIEEGWFGEGEDVRHAAHHADTKQVEQFKKEAKEAVITTTKPVTRGGGGRRKMYSTSDFENILTGLAAGLSNTEIAKETGKSEPGVSRVAKAFKLLKQPDTDLSHLSSRYRIELPNVADRIRPIAENMGLLKKPEPVTQTPAKPEPATADVLERANKRRQELLDQVAQIDAALKTLEELL